MYSASSAKPQSRRLAWPYYGLYALQHRGQESCGIVVNDDGVFFSRKDLGLLSQVFSQEELARFPKGAMAVGPCEVRHYRGRKSRQLPTH